MYIEPKKGNHSPIDVKSLVVIGYGIGRMAPDSSGVRLEEHMHHVVL